MTPSEHEKICPAGTGSDNIRKKWRVRSTLTLGKGEEKKRVHLVCTSLKCGHRITSSETEEVSA